MTYVIPWGKKGGILFVEIALQSRFKVLAFFYGSSGMKLESNLSVPRQLTSGTFPAENSSFFLHPAGVITKIYEVWLRK